MQRVMQRAAENHGYLYNVYPMIKAYLEGWDPGHPLHQLTEFLQSDELREFGRRVIGAERITKVDAQATCYGPDSDNIHGIDESVGLASLHEVTRVLALTIADWCGVERG